MNKLTLKNDFLTIEYLTDALRISGLTPSGRTNLLVEMRDESSVSTPFGDFHYLGGHRLWHSPEAMPRTYIPDRPVTVTELSDGVILDTQTEPGTGIRKRMEIRLVPDRPSVTLTHTLINDGMWVVELAPWAITQFNLGGVGILPMPVGNVFDVTGLLPNRRISLWAYSHFNDPRIRWDDEFVLFKADSLPPFKVGYFNPHGWLAYWLDGVLFRKTFGVQIDVTYPDNNCNAEMYCNDKFMELESLAPLTRLEPGNSVNHIEIWDIFYNLEPIPHHVRDVILTF